MKSFSKAMNARKSSDELIDKRADALALLTHPVRRRIRDALRRKGELTLTELAKTIGESEPNTYHHVSKLVQAGIVIKRNDTVAGRLVTFYSLSDYYYELFSNEAKPDLFPILALFTVYSLMTVVTIAFPSYALSLFAMVGIRDFSSAIVLCMVGIFSTLVVLLYYMIPEIVKFVKNRFEI